MASSVAAATPEYYVGVRQVRAYPGTRAGIDGYYVRYPDGMEDWVPSDAFEAEFMHQGENPTKVSQEMVAGMYYDSALTRLANHAVVCVELTNGFTLVADSACVEASNYDAMLGGTMAVEKASDQVWPLLGFVLAWARNGLRPKPRD